MSRYTRSLLLGLFVLATALLLAPLAQAWQSKPHGRDSGTVTTQRWILTRAASLAAANGADWLDLDVALDAVGEPDVVFRDFGYHVYDRWGRARGKAPSRAAHYYNVAVAALKAEDISAASHALGLLAHYYTDICNPLHTDHSKHEARMHRRYEYRVQRLLNRGSMTRLAQYLQEARPVEVTTNVRRFGVQTARAAHRDYRRLVRAFTRHGYNRAVARVTRASLERATVGLASIIAKAKKDKDHPPTVPTPTPSPSATPTTTPTPTPSASPTPSPQGLLDVKAYGAHGDGVNDDTAAITAAMKAAASAGSGVYVPAGTYRVSTVSIPNGITVQGDGHAVSWFRGGVLFGSRDLVSGLKLGDVGKRTHNAADATQTVFEECRFRGTAPIVLGDDHSCSYITFRDCLVERSFGGWTPECMNNNVIIEEYSPGPYGHVAHITFERCHVGVSNGSGGHDTGSPGAGFVCHVNPRPPYNQGYHDIRIIDCVFEATDEFTLDFDDRVDANGRHTASDVLIEGCTIKGGGYAGEKRFAYTICFEAPEGCVVRDNLIYRGYINTFKICKNEDPDPDRRPLIVEGNTFDLTVDNGVDTPQGVSMIRLHGDNNIFRNNTIITDLPDDAETGDAPGAILKLYYARNAQISDNKVYDRASTRNPLLLHFYSASRNVVTGNYFWSGVPGGLEILSQAGSTANVLTDNTFVH
jgi:hypothetical protein